MINCNIIEIIDLIPMKRCIDLKNAQTHEHTNTLTRASSFKWMKTLVWENDVLILSLSRNVCVSEDSCDIRLFLLMFMIYLIDTVAMGKEMGSFSLLYKIAYWLVYMLHSLQLM